MAKVRCATARDAAALLEMGRAMHAESPRYRVRGWDEAKVRAQIERLTSQEAQGGALVLIAERGGEVAGMAAVFVAEDWFGPDRHVTDLVVYVRPEHRGSGAFLRLVRGLEAWARDVGVPEIRIGVSTGVHTDETLHAYERLGYALTPTRIVTKDLDHVHRS